MSEYTEETLTLEAWLRRGTFEPERLKAALRLGLETGQRRVYLGGRDGPDPTPGRVACYLRIPGQKTKAHA